MGLCFRFNRHRTHDRLHTRHQLVFQNTPCVEAVERVIRKRGVPCERRVGMLRFGRRGALGVPLGNLDDADVEVGGELRPFIAMAGHTLLPRIQIEALGHRDKRAFRASNEATRGA